MHSKKPLHTLESLLAVHNVSQANVVGETPVRPALQLLLHAGMCGDEVWLIISHHPAALSANGCTLSIKNLKQLSIYKKTCPAIIE